MVWHCLLFFCLLRRLIEGFGRGVCAFHLHFFSAGASDLNEGKFGIALDNSNVSGLFGWRSAVVCRSGQIGSQAECVPALNSDVVTS